MRKFEYLYFIQTRNIMEADLLYRNVKSETRVKSCLVHDILGPSDGPYDPNLSSAI